ncbi:MAG: dihydrodipicolinate synthase family protein [Pyrinomonadaceae bacterium]
MTEAAPDISKPAGLSSHDVCGVLLPITTPFHADGALDLHGLGSNLAKWNETDISGYVLLGSTGERVHLDEKESLEVIVKGREEVPSGKIFIVGAGQQSTRGTVDEIKRIAAAVMVDAVLVITPHFYRPAMTQSTLVDHYLAVADESPVPVVLYSMPALTGIRIEPETAERLSDHPNIIGIKDSSADTERLQKTAKRVREEFSVLSGNGTVLCEALKVGARGGILAVGCVVPDLCLEIFRAVKAGDIELASHLQGVLSPLAEAVTTRFGIGGLKVALEMKGYNGGAVRTPLRPPDESGRREIRRCLEEAEKGLQEHSTGGDETPRRYTNEVRVDA